MGKIALRDDILSTRTHQHYDEWLLGDGTTTVFHLAKTPVYLTVTVDGAKKRPSVPGTTYDYSLKGSTVTFVTAPASGKHVCFSQVSS